MPVVFVFGRGSYLSVYRYATMSRARASVSFSSGGMATPGVIACGFSIQRSMFAGVFGKAPPMIARDAIPVSGGATVPSAPATPSIRWQLPHPTAAIVCRPRSGLPIEACGAVAQALVNKKTMKAHAGASGACERATLISVRD